MNKYELIIYLKMWQKIKYYYMKQSTKYQVILSNQYSKKYLTEVCQDRTFIPYALLDTIYKWSLIEFLCLFD